MMVAEDHGRWPMKDERSVGTLTVIITMTKTIGKDTHAYIYIPFKIYIQYVHRTYIHTIYACSIYIYMYIYIYIISTYYAVPIMTQSKQ